MAGSVYRDRSKLGPAYVPESLVDREDELRSLARLFRPTFESGASQRALVFGSQGSGKTAIARASGAAVLSAAEKRRIKMRFAYVDCRE